MKCHIPKSILWSATMTSAFGITLSAAGQTVIAQTLTSEEPVIEPIPEFQAQIKRIMEPMEPRDLQSSYAEFARLRTIAYQRQRETVGQLVHFTDHIMEGDLGIRVMGVRSILDMMSDIDDHVIVSVLAPYLGSSDEGVKSLVLDWFQYHDSSGVFEPTKALQPVNYSQYKDYLRGKVLRKKPIPKAFVEYIYRRPRHAFLAFIYAHDRVEDAREGSDRVARSEATNALLWSEHVISDAIWRKEYGFDEKFEEAKPAAIEHLERLSQHEDWWVRLYVAKIVQGFPELSTEAITDRLRADQHELLRDIMTQESAKQK